MSWSRVVASPAEAAAVLAELVEPGAADGPLDLRTAADLTPEWAQLGFTELVERGEPLQREPVAGGTATPELVRPVAVHLPDVDATVALGVRLGRDLRAGDLVVLDGPLGAGKTALTRGVGAALGVRGSVTSPTFVLARVHRGPVPLVHVDAYRLRGATVGQDTRLELDDLDLDDDLPHSVTVVEWGEGVVEGLSPSRLHVILGRGRPARWSSAALGGDGTTRTVTDHRIARVRAVGPRWSVVQPP